MYRMKKLDKLPKPKKRKIKSDTSGPLNVGSTRMRLFKALSRNTDGLTVREIKELTGMDHRSGHLSNVLVDEIKRGRIVKLTGYRRETSIEVYVYVLSLIGQQDFDNGLIDGNRGAGNRIGTPWTPAKACSKSTPVSSSQSDN